ncbi:unnamed protein product [Sphagnum jensenii]|uniref:glycerophosphodiester phosphodiesterase n=1 Tax=Sphagnum jensenii TaxID=128206 RepID=A0ABP0V5J7_9BRYO
MRRELFVILSLICGISVSGCISNTAPANTSSTPKVEVHAHRGGAALRPENSLAAFTNAVADVGVDSIELDIHPTTDSVLIVNHDDTVNPSLCLNPDGSQIAHPPVISHSPSTKIQKYDCGTLVGLPKDTSLPTLNKVIETVEALAPINGKPAQYDIHVKGNPKSITATQYATLILDVVQAYGIHDRVHIMNSSWTFLQAVRALDSTISIYYLTSQIQPGDLDSAVEVNATAVAPLGDTLDATTVQTFHAQGIQVIAWTINASYRWKSLMDIGVDGIITDNPVGLDELINGNLTDQLTIGPAGD